MIYIIVSFHINNGSFFSSGQKYRVKKSNGEEGIMTKCIFGDHYDYK